MDIWHRIITGLFGRLDGPLHFRFYMQPAMAIILAVMDGIKDAKAGRPAYFWDIVSNPAERKELVILGLKRLSKIIILAVVLDVIYQVIVFHWFYPGETVIVVIFLAIIPYLLVRGPVDRIITWRMKKAA